MKDKIHPEYKIGTIKCACGNTFQVRNTVGDLKVEICSACHPFFTGKQKLVDSAGRVEKFMKKYGYSEKKDEPKNNIEVESPPESDKTEEVAATKL